MPTLTCSNCGQAFVAAQGSSLAEQCLCLDCWEGGASQEWLPPDQDAIYEITKAVAQDLAGGEEKEFIIQSLVAEGGWPEEVAAGFVDKVEEKSDRHLLSLNLSEVKPDATGRFLSKKRSRVARAFGSRIVMGAIALVLVVGSIWLLNWARAEDAECEASGGWLRFCLAEELTFWFVALPAWIIAGLFALGAILPAGNFRGLVMALGVGLPVGIVILYVSAPLSLAVIGDPEAAILVGSIPALAAFYIAGSAAYRLAGQ